MARLLFFILFLLGCCYCPAVMAQDTLPKFSVRNVGNNRIIIGWVNQFTNISQISIQRAFDSLGNYKTILSVPDAKAIQNGFADTKAPNDHMYYRLFYAMEGGAFYFTKSKKSAIDTSTNQNAFIISDKNVTGEATNPLLKSFTPSFYVYTEKRGYVQLNLPNADQRKYSLKFFEEDGSFLFELKAIKDRSLTLDKSNFLHAGWFTFELYDDEKVVEKHKFYIAKDF
ncbi:MAG TPA: hypothetical protein VEY06_15505 [Flavisolibacter sp.]|jgi:hypothetical protein|nr:hypothetical protein [Flavisolibacter sp.]